MKVKLVFVTPGDNRGEYALNFELPAPPSAGDYISIRRPDSDGRTEDFIVRRTRWFLEHPETRAVHAADDAKTGKDQLIVVECEHAISALSADSHVAGAGPAAKHFDDPIIS